MTTPHKSGNERVILLFLGWGMDGNVAAGITRAGYDILTVWDYREPHFAEIAAAVEHYREIVVIGWSMGVLYASEFILSNPSLPITKTIAVAGSLWPRHSQKGIPENIYDATAAVTDQRQMERFYRRVCGSAAAMSRLMPAMPVRDIDGLRNELAAITRFAGSCRKRPDIFDEIILCGNDLIFPIENLRRAWATEAERITELPDSPHFAPFQQIVDRFVVDKQLVGTRFASAAPTYDANATVQKRVSHRLASMIPLSEGVEVLEIGSGTGIFTSEYQKRITGSKILAFDIAPGNLEATDGNTITVEQTDGETAVRHMPGESFDIILSSSTIQWFNSPRRFISEVMRLLHPGGEAYLSFYVAGTLEEVDRISPENAMHYAPIETGFAARISTKCSVETETYTLDFPTAADALRHIRATGVNALKRAPLSPALTRQLMAAITSDGTGTATLRYRAIFLTLKK